MDSRVELIRSRIRDVPDFPKPGILFKDIAPLLEHAEAFRACIDLFAERWAGQKLDSIVALESRGFPFGGALAYRLGLGLGMVRKRGKLPYEKRGIDYALEYGTDRIEMHVDAVARGDRVLLVDDLLATGGTASAAVRLIEGEFGAEVVGCAFVVDLAFLNGAARLTPPPIHALVKYE